MAALKGAMTMAELSATFEVHGTQVTRRRRHAAEGLTSFTKEIGRLKVENEWLRKKSELFAS